MMIPDSMILFINKGLRPLVCSRSSLFLILFVFAMVLSSCGSSDENNDDKKAKYKIAFSAVKVPDTDALKRAVTTSGAVTINDDDQDIGYQTIMRSGDDINGTTFGLIVDRNGTPVLTQSGGRFVSNESHFSSLLQVDKSIYNITQFESCPGAMYLTEVSQHSDSGFLPPIGSFNLDVSQWGGVWMPSGGSVTPWGTHLGGEKDSPDARLFENAVSVDDIDTNIKLMLRYYGISDPFSVDLTLAEITEVFNPYQYGYPLEVEIEEDGNAIVNKRYAMGRLSIEQAYVMPDQKTVYITDSGENGGLFIFVADEKQDLSSGTLFAAEWVQKDSIEGGMADINWIDLGHATQERIGDTINNGFKFTDLFDVGRANPDRSCPDGFESINTGDFGHECLAVRTGMENAASRLETRRYAAMMGATTEFKLTGGVAYDKRSNVLFVAVNEINNGMEDNMVGGTNNSRYDQGGWNHIQLPYNCCGCVYGMKLRESDHMKSKYVAKNIYGVLCGEMQNYGEGNPYAANKCDVDNIANPAALTFLNGSDTLIIGEDSLEGHENNALWAYRVREGDLVRIQTAPYGAAIVSSYFYPDINGFSYLTSVIKHPYRAPHEDKLINPVDGQSYIGYIGAMPAF
jgi:hypothetical protein